MPNGWCLLPPRQHCSKGNACLTCDKFATDATFLPELTTQLTRTEQLIVQRRQTFNARTGQDLSEDNVWLAGRRRNKSPRPDHRQARADPAADGSIQALRGAGASARTDATPAAATTDSAMRGNPGNLRQEAAAKSAAAKARAENGLEQIIRRGDPITFRGLAQIAGVSLDFSTAPRDPQPGRTPPGPAAGHAHPARATPRP